MDSIEVIQSNLSLITNITWQPSANATSYNTSLMCNDDSFNNKSDNVTTSEYQVYLGIPQLLNCNFSVTPRNGNSTGNRTQKEFQRIGKFMLSLGVQTYLRHVLNQGSTWI